MVRASSPIEQSMKQVGEWSTRPLTHSHCKRENRFYIRIYRRNETKFDNTNNKNVTTPYLFIEKAANASGSYDDGIFIRFANSTPQHITFEMYTEDPDIETCDFRLTTVDNSTNSTNSTNSSSSSNTTSTVRPGNTTNSTNATRGENFTKVQWQDVAFFRFGYFNYQKLNLLSMVKKFTNGTWYKVDLLVDWES